MKKTMMLLLSLTTLVFSWNLQKVIDSEGTQTNVISCKNGKIKAVKDNKTVIVFFIFIPLLYNFKRVC